jgi:hypothetical protein
MRRLLAAAGTITVLFAAAAPIALASEGPPPGKVFCTNRFPPFCFIVRPNSESGVPLPEGVVPGQRRVRAP